MSEPRPPQPSRSTRCRSLRLAPKRGQRTPPGEPQLLRCDTCGRLTTRVSRVVIDRGYDRSNARPLWNCPDCFEKKNREREGG